MTKSEARQMQRLKDEVEVLREHHTKSMRIYGEQLTELIDLRIKLKTLIGLIAEMAEEIAQ